MIKHQFNQVPMSTLKRSTFNRSSTVKGTAEHGKLIPFYVDEIIPGDTVVINPTMLARLATPLYPIMDNIRCDIYGFFWGIRPAWENYTRFEGAQDTPGASIAYTIPTVDVKTHTTGSLSDYFGIPVGPSAYTNALNVNAIPYRMYNKIYNEWFRPQELIGKLNERTGDTGDLATDYTIQKVSKLHDYLTSGLTASQRGDEIDLPLGNVAPVIGIGTENQVYTSASVNIYETGKSSTTNYTSTKQINPASSDTNFVVAEDANNTGYPGIYADLSNATASSISQLRNAFALQRFLERDARGGTRFPEILRSRFGITNYPDAPYRPELLFHKRMNINVTPVANTSGTATEPQGNLAGYGTGSMSGKMSNSFMERGYLMFLMCFRADLTYQENLEKMWTRSTRYDFFDPLFQGLSEQAVLTHEVFYTDEANGVDGTTNQTVFSYMPRYDEYRFKGSKILGQFRSNATANFDEWHLSQQFGSAPTLNQTFIEETAPMTRIKATSTDPDYIFDIYMENYHTRPMSTYGVPGMGNRF